VTGGYHYDPRLPLVNRYLIGGDPTAALRPALDMLIGQTGSEPLAEKAPLARYEFVSVRLHRFHSRDATVHVRFTYDDGSHRTYPLTLSQNLTAARR
jgi:hypothetical protein